MKKLVQRREGAPGEVNGWLFDRIGSACILVV